ncbi:hypothetical protein [Glycomyces sp. NPDC047010]|uniref:hypothetical protein n=1 Tax=Glycomyces sp. NPDC047010 TaxID=3155023 RepID=UPI003408D94D
MRTKLFQGLVGAAAVAAVLGAGAAPAYAETAAVDTSAVEAAAAGTYSQVVGTNTLTIDPTTAAGLSALGIEHYGLFATKTEAALTTYQFKVVGDPSDGTVELRGGIVFTGDCEYAVITGLVIDSATGTVSGRVNLGGRIDLFRLGGTTAQGVAWHFTGAGATALNDALGVAAVRTSRILGYDATVLA